MTSSSEDNDDNLDTSHEPYDDERNLIQSELSNLSFEELQKLKERIGAKIYNEAVFGTKKSKVDPKHKMFKRENKNRPREMSSKIPVSMLKDAFPVKKKKEEIRDPRFDPLCGEFDKKQFNENYNFLSDLRMKDIKAIRAELKETTDTDKVVHLRRLLQRLNDQHKAGRKHKVEQESNKKQKVQLNNEFSQGKHPHFKNKSERRVESLVSQYEELKREGTGRIQRHLKRREQKRNKRSHKAPTGAG